MSRLKLAVVTAVVTAVALSATAAMASAHEFKVEGSAVTERTNLETHEFTSLNKYVLTGTPFLVSVKLECSSVHEEGSINAGGLGTATLQFKSCTAVKPANCSVSEPITTAVNTSLVTGSLGVENQFVPPEGSPFTTITLTGAECKLKEPFPVSGSQKCELPGGETEAVEHEINCTTGGSALKAGGAAAKFAGEISGLKLESGAKWSAH